MKINLFLLGMLAALLLLGGCAKPDPEPVLRQRVTSYTQMLLDDQFDEAVKSVAPDIVAAKGSAKLTGEFRAALGIVKGLAALGGRKAAGFEVRRVEFAAAKTRATVQIVLFTTASGGGDRQEHPTDQQWWLKQKTWFAVP